MPVMLHSYATWDDDGPSHPGTLAPCCWDRCAVAALRGLNLSRALGFWAAVLLTWIWLILATLLPVTTMPKFQTPQLAEAVEPLWLRLSWALR